MVVFWKQLGFFESKSSNRVTKLLEQMYLSQTRNMIFRITFSVYKVNIQVTSYKTIFILVESIA